jgi:hypothetical protein
MTGTNTLAYFASYTLRLNKKMSPLKPTIFSSLMTGQEKLERLSLVIYAKDKHTSLFSPTVIDEHKKLNPGTKLFSMSLTIVSKNLG